MLHLNYAVLQIVQCSLQIMEHIRHVTYYISLH